MSEAENTTVIEAGPALPTAQSAQVTNLFQVLEGIANNPDADADKMVKVMEMVERAQDRDAEQAYAASMVAAQSEIPHVSAKRRNQQTNSNYAKHEDIVAQAGPIWAKHGFALSFGQEPGAADDHMKIICDCMHAKGHTKRYEMELALDSKGIKGTTNKTEVHASGSTFSYGQRYLTCKIFNIPTGDDRDGNSPVAKALTITEAQAKEIHELIGDDMEFSQRAMKWLVNQGIESIEAIPANQFNKLKAGIKRSKNANS